TYYVRWLALGGCSPSACASVTVSPNSNPTVTQQPTSQVGCVGQSTSFSVAVTSNPPPFSYRWRKDLVNLNDGGNISGAQTPTLTINPVAVADAGGYDCIISANCGQIGSNQVSLWTSAPNFLSQPSSQTMCVGQELSLFALAAGNQQVSYQWRRN